MGRFQIKRTGDGGGGEGGGEFGGGGLGGGEGRGGGLGGSGVRTHAPGGPSKKPLDLAYVPVHTLLSELSKPQLVYALSHCGAPVNIVSNA
jgi:hypothetical protein